MQLGMIGLGRMGGSMVQRLLRGGPACVVFDSQRANVTSLVLHGAAGSHSLEEFIDALDTPRVVWLMVPAAVVDTTLDELSPRLQPGDVVIDGGNSHYVDDIRRSKALEARGVHYLDVGVSRRHLGNRTWVLSDDWRRQRGRGPPRPDLQGARSGLGCSLPNACTSHREQHRRGGGTCIAVRLVLAIS